MVAMHADVRLGQECKPHRTQRTQKNLLQHGTKTKTPTAENAEKSIAGFLPCCRAIFAISAFFAFFAVTLKESIAGFLFFYCLAIFAVTHHAIWRLVIRFDR
jgi:hypothetical protein